MLDWLLWLYPEDFRRRFHGELEAAFEELRGWAWASAMTEFAGTGLRERLAISGGPLAAAACALLLHAGLYSILLPIARAADTPGQTLAWMERRYAGAARKFAAARSIGDLDRLNAWMDTPDWRSAVNGREQTWADLRKYGFKNLWTPTPMSFRITQFRVTESGAELELRMGRDGIRVVDQWRRTPQGWRRWRHEKFP